MTFFSSPARIGILLLGVVALTGCSRESKVKRHLARGDENVAAGHYDFAEVEYQAALSLEPENSKALGRLGTLCFNQGRIVPAYLALQNALKKNPEDLELQLTFGLVSHTLARTTEARAAARKVLDAQPANDDALLLLAETCVTTRDNEETRKLLEQLRQTAGKDSAGFHVALGSLQLARREDAAAEAELRKALELDPKSGAAHAQLGRLYLLKGDVKKAAEALKSASDLSPLRSPRRIKYIELLVQTDAFDEAKKELAAITGKAPDFIPALLLEARVAFEQARFDDASALADKVLLRDRTNHDALLQRAAAKLAQGNAEAAIGTLRQMEEFYPQSHLVKYRIARAYAKKGEFAAAEENVQKAILLSPNFDDAILLLAELNLQKGNPAAAVTTLTQLLKRQPRLPRAYVLLAQAHQTQGEMAEALKVLRMFAGNFPRLPEAPYLVAVALFQSKQTADARQALEQAVQLKEDFWPALEMLVNFDLLENRLKPAQERAQALVQKFPGDAVAWLCRAKVRLQEGDLKGAESDLLKMLELDPKQQHAYLLLAKTYYDQKQGQQAAETLSKLATQTNKVGAFMQLGVLQTVLKQYDAARAAYEKALAVDPKFVPALNNLATLLADNLGQLDRAQSLAAQARELAPSDPHVTDTLGWILVRKGQAEAGLSLLRSSADKMPAEPQIQYHLAMANYQLGREEAARQAFQIVADASTDLPAKTDARNRLAVLAIDPTKADAAARAELESRLAREPNDPVVLTRLATIEAREGANNQAATHFEAVLKINPRASRAMLALVELYAGPLKNPTRARELAKAAHAAASHDGEAAWKLGRIAYDLGDFSWAVTVLQDAARSLASQPELTLDVARALYSVGRVAEAEQALQDLAGGAARSTVRDEARRMTTMIAAATSPTQAAAALPAAREILTAQPDFVPALLVTALAAQQQGDHKAAKEGYEKVLARYPTFTPATRHLAILYAEYLGDDKKAQELAVKARQVFPDDAELAYSLGSIYYRRGDYPEAVRLLGQSARKRENHAETFFLLGMAQFHLKKASESRTQLQRALRLNLPAHEANEAKRVLEQLSRGELVR